jgi:hypothetical protein
VSFKNTLSTTYVKSRLLIEKYFGPLGEKVELISSTSSSVSGSHSNTESIEIDLYSNPQPGPSTADPNAIFRPHLKNFLTPRLALSLDKANVSDTDAMHIISATAEALEYDISKLVLSRATIRRFRIEARKKRAERIKEEFGNINLKAPVIHWDGKMLPALTGKEIIDRLPVILSDGDFTQILKIPALEDGTGESQAEAVHETLCEWNLREVVVACCFDTTATNTGPKKGACNLLEKKLQRDLMYLACRHHIYEIMLRAAFECKIKGTTGPVVPLFKKFGEYWSKINKSAFLSGMEDEKITAIFDDTDKTEIVNFLKNQLKLYQPRDDYRELIELSLIFLGEAPLKPFSPPGSISHARWMAKAIYSLKIFLFRNEYNLTAEEEESLADICAFIVKIYIKAWFLAPSATISPRVDFQFIKDLKSYEKIDRIMSKMILNKFINHLWYLAPETVAFSFFDEELSMAVKEEMRQAYFNHTPEMEGNESDDDEFGVDAGDEEEEEEMMQTCKKFEINRKSQNEQLEEILQKSLAQFIGPDTKNFFKRFKIKPDFLKRTPDKWVDDLNYQFGKEIISKLKVTNDVAERGVQLIKDYNRSRTKNEEQQQYLIQVVSDYHKKYPDYKKSTLSLRGG